MCHAGLPSVRRSVPAVSPWYGQIRAEPVRQAQRSAVSIGC
ncbi:hypothetical protein FM105_08485 [Brevibacterium yomogidense]|uniref:Uncharacterized protein n=1 Tax=Brevibacterium yomogidense TaxID=946573 RepID=A0A1X6XI51_9MICO|nr:hypothetical protein FM105_08485 [Brevibacterium yomogidense]